ncbi:MAG: histidine--tRNA ligase [Pseudomonadota bacterium]|nr:histidine--tRNA ligase [Pseudomonadota bacterium]
MTNDSSKNTLKAALPRGLRDTGHSELDLIKNITSKIIPVYESYGFEELSTPSFEYTSALGKFLPDSDRPNAGVFSFQDDDEKWLSLRYDLTSPLARYVAENFDKITKPYKRYQLGNVWRNEKPGPGRYREFLQLDADIIGSNSYGVDAELIMLSADSMSSLGLNDENYNIRVSSRKLLDAILALVSDSEDIDEVRRLTILRAIDKLDRIGIDGVQKLLSEGRKDVSGGYTIGAKLQKASISKILDFISIGSQSRDGFISQAIELVGENDLGQSAIEELRSINNILDKLNYNKSVVFDSSIVRGLEYYTGVIFEANLVSKDNDKNLPVIGSVGGGGRYDKLISRFRKDQVGASGFSIGVSRLCTVMQMMGFEILEENYGPILILNMDKDYEYSYYQMAQDLRAYGIKAEVYLGTAGMKAQMKYADKKGSPLVIIEGTVEREKGIVTIKNLTKGKEVSATIGSRDNWIKNDEIQFEVIRSEVVKEISQILKKDKT